MYLERFLNAAWTLLECNLWCNSLLLAPSTTQWNCDPGRVNGYLLSILWFVKDCYSCNYQRWLPIWCSPSASLNPGLGSPSPNYNRCPEFNIQFHYHRPAQKWMHRYKYNSHVLVLQFLSLVLWYKFESTIQSLRPGIKTWIRNLEVLVWHNCN